MRGRTRHVKPEASARGSARPPWRRRLRGLVVLLATAAVVVGLAPAASAAYGPEPVGPAWTPNGGVHAVVVDAAANRVYVGGSFTGGVAALRADTGALLWNGNANGDVRALALGPNGRLLLGGAFTTVGGTTHRKLAAVNAGTGAVDNAFKPAVGGTVRDIVVVGSNAYFGGLFTSHNGIAQGGLGAVDAVTGKAVTAFKASTNSQVYSLGTNGTRLFIGGKFTAVDGQPRNYLASVTLSTNTLDPWAPPLACSKCNVIWDLTVDASRNRVYTAGRNAGGLNIVNMSTGARIYTLGGFNGDTQALTLAPDGRLYVGGHFVTVGGVARELVAEFDVSGADGTRPVLKDFSTNFVTTWPGVWAMASTSSRLYVGGDFTVAGTQTKKYPYFAMFSSGSTPPPADTTAPTVTTRSPAANATGVAANTDVTATFSEPVQGVTTSTFTLAPAGGGAAVAATVSQGTGNQWVLNPNADLAAGTQYTATLTGGTTAIRDAADNPLVTTSWTFTTTAPPADTTPPTATVVPANGATGVAPNGDVSATFSEPVQGVSGTTFTLTGGGAAVPATVSQGTGNQWILNPNADLAAGTQYTATLTGGTTAIRDMADNPFATMTWSFTTAAATGDTTAPTVTATHPRNGATGINVGVSPNAQFSEVVINVNTTTFTLRQTDTGEPIPGRVVWNSTLGRWVFNPDPTLAANTQYTVSLSVGVTDEAGNPLAAPVEWSFTTAA